MIEKLVRKAGYAPDNFVDYYYYFFNDNIKHIQFYLKFFTCYFSEFIYYIKDDYFKLISDRSKLIAVIILDI